MRVLHIYSGNLFGGIETMLVTFARAQVLVPELQHEFALTFPGRLADELTAAGAEVHDLGAVRASRPHTILRSRKALNQVLGEASYDGAICHGAWPYALFASTVRRARLPLVFWAHGAIGGPHWTERWARRTLPELIVCNSKYTADSGAEVWPNVPRQVVYCPVAAPVQRTDEADWSALRRELSTPADAVVTIQVSRIEELKGQEIHLAAIGQLRQQDDLHCWIVGGPQRPQELDYFNRLKTQAATLGMADRIHFLGERADIPRLLSAADIYCQPNLTAESFGISFVEALYAGLPVVTSALGGALEIVDESCGMLVPRGDVSALSAALKNLLTDPVRRREMGASGPARAAILSDPEQQTRRLLESMEQMVGSTGAKFNADRTGAASQV